jgi:hypothetical protein
MRFLLWALLCVSLQANATTTTLADCAQATVQSAINAATDGDIIVCPAGSWSWSDVNIVNHNVTLKGNGIGSTIISITAAGGIEATSSNTKPFRITGFTFRSTGNFGTDSGKALMRIQGGKGWRIDHNRFELFSNVESYNGGNGIYTKNEVSGVIDHNYFTKNTTTAGSTGCMHASVYPEGAGVTAWGWNTQIWRFNRTVFIEDNEFYNPNPCTASHNAHAVYGQYGGIFVARHNTIHGMNIDSHGFCETHSMREFEISNNTWVGVGSNNLFAALDLKGATGVVYDNVFGGTITYAFWFRDRRAEGLPCGGGEAYQGYASSASCPEGYPCKQQIGRGKDNVLDPLYIWGNTGASTILNTASSFIQSGRDYYLNAGAKPGYLAYPYPHPLTLVSDSNVPAAPRNPRTP